MEEFDQRIVQCNLSPGIIVLKIAIFTSGLWSQRREVETLAGMPAVFCRSSKDIPLDVAAVGGWGFKESADYARKVASEHSLPYWAFEDGPLRAVFPGVAEPTSSMVIDREGIFYDAQSNSSLQRLFDEAANLTKEDIDLASKARQSIVSNRLSKYNNSDPEHVPDSIHRIDAKCSVLVVDQTLGDAAIKGALATGSEFDQMLDYVLKNQDYENIVVKTHPDVVAGLKKGMLSHVPRDRRIILLSDDNVSPWVLFERVNEVHTVSSLLGFEALLADKEVHCWGAAFYSGRGLTVDHFDNALPRRKKIGIEAAIFATYFRYTKYFDHWTREELSFFDAVEQLVFLREHFLKNPYKLFSGLPASIRRSVYKHWIRPAPGF